MVLDVELVLVLGFWGLSKHPILPHNILKLRPLITSRRERKPRSARARRPRYAGQGINRTQQNH